ncbi:tetratricopeptide repeat protein [bacterium]|nr:MAG: tetratricopeptide repeat protein [bacterium]
MKITQTVFFIMLLMPSMVVGGLFTNYAQQKPEETIAELEKKQIDAPHDPYVNYNLGVALYKAGNYAQAVKNFERVAANKKIDEDFSLRARFNAGNSSYRAALEGLGTGWEEKKELDDKILEQAIAQTKAAIASYQEVIKLDDDHEPAKNNKKLADELLKKLEEKKKKQEQEKQDKKDQEKDKEKQDNKQDKDKQDKNDQQKQQDKKDNKNDKKDQKKDEQGQQDRDKSDQQDDKNKQEEGQQNEGDRDQSKQDGDQEKQENQDANKSDEQKEQERKEREQQEQEEQAKTAEQKEQEAAQAAAARAAQGQEQDKDDEGIQKRGVRALLENLDEDESKKQKGFIVQQVKGGNASERQGQKPW